MKASLVLLLLALAPQVMAGRTKTLGEVDNILAAEEPEELQAKSDSLLEAESKEDSEYEAKEDCVDEYEPDGTIPKPWDDFVSCKAEAKDGSPACGENPTTLGVHCRFSCKTCEEPPLIGKHTIKAALDDKCLIFGGSGRDEHPSRHLWAREGEYCGLANKAELISNKQAVWKIQHLEGDKYTIKAALDDKCLIFGGNGEEQYPSRHLWSTEGEYCGFDNRAALISNQQAVWTLQSLEAPVTKTTTTARATQADQVQWSISPDSQGGSGSCDTVCSHLGRTCSQEALDDLGLSSSNKHPDALKQAYEDATGADLACNSWNTHCSGGNCANWGLPFIHSSHFNDRLCWGGDAAAPCDKVPVDGHHRRLCPCGKTQADPELRVYNKDDNLQWTMLYDSSNLRFKDNSGYYFQFKDASKAVGFLDGSFTEPVEIIQGGHNWANNGGMRLKPNGEITRPDLVTPFHRNEFRWELVKAGLKEEVFYNIRNMRKLPDVRRRRPSIVREVSQPYYRNTGGKWPGFSQRDNFAVRWTGTLNINTAGQYTFTTYSDDGSRMWLDGSAVVNNDGCHGWRAKTGRKQVSTGKHEFRAEMFENGGGAGMEVLYQGSDTSNRRMRIPSSAFSPAGPAPTPAPTTPAPTTKPPATTPAPTTVCGPERGLKQEVYYNIKNMRHLPKFGNRKASSTRTVAEPYYKNTGNPWPTFSQRDDYAVRWTGGLNIKKEGYYHFETYSDDGSKMWIDNSEVVNNDGVHGWQGKSGPMLMAPGAHLFKTEMFEKGGGQGIEVKYKGPDTNDQMQRIPSSAFSCGD